MKPSSVLFVLFICNCLHEMCWGNLNLYMSQSEVRRILGLNAELFYVRDGVVNDYALNFSVPVPAHISELYFIWQSLTGMPLPYVVKLRVSDSEALVAPLLNISHTGHIPVVAEAFMVSLSCSKAVDAEVDVILNLNISLNKLANNITTLTFRRKKICLKGGETASGDSRHVVVVDSESPPANTIYIAVGSACVLIVIIVVGMAAYYVHNSKAHHQQADALQESRNGSTGNALAHTTFLKVHSSLPNNMIGTSASSCASYASFKRLPSYNMLDDKASQELHERIVELTIPRSSVQLHRVVLEGTFGRVYQGSYIQGKDGPEEQVLVKTVTDHASQVQISLLLQEGMTMYNLHHKNILSVLGVSIEDHTAPYVIYSNQEYTNLKRFLQMCKLCPEGVAHTLTTQEVVGMALQIIQGMQFLHKKHLLHRDLATRNCVVDPEFHVRITEQALARDLFPADYHCLGDNFNRPVKWLAIESLVHNTFSTVSDVWSYGVLLWELTTLAQQPYVEIDPFEMAAYLRDGYRLSQPINCPDELFAVMAYCWAMSPDERPTFSQLQICLQDFYKQLTKYV